MFPGIQMAPPDSAVVPPNLSVFSRTSADRPRSRAVSAAVNLAAPEPITTTS
jgi:hypothetical protein